MQGGAREEADSDDLNLLGHGYKLDFSQWPGDETELIRSITQIENDVYTSVGNDSVQECGLDGSYRGCGGIIGNERA